MTLLKSDKPIKNFLECPVCGEYQELGNSDQVQDVLCSICRNMIHTDRFAPAVVVYKLEDD